MIIEVRLCDVCRAEIPEWPLNISAGRENSPTGDHLNVDFCSLDCLRTWVCSLAETGR